MIEQVYRDPDVFRINIPLPNNPLKNLNSYIIKTPEKNLIIDNGFNMDECYEVLQAGLKELDVDIKKTELFLTHLHSDHIGLTKRIMPEDAVIYMSGIDYDNLVEAIQNDAWNDKMKIYEANGLKPDEIAMLEFTNPIRRYLPDGYFPVHRIKDGDHIQVGPYDFTCVLTPGHTPGHCCLYLEDKELLFLGDHLLFTITPNITFWIGVEDSLSLYQQSLDKIGALKVKTALPGHRECGKNFYARIQELHEHHDARLQECLRIVRKNPGLTAYDIAGKMQWAIHARCWDEFPVNQKFFATGEAIAHLDFLKKRNYVETEQTPDGHIIYTATKRFKTKAASETVAEKNATAQN